LAGKRPPIISESEREIARSIIAQAIGDMSRPRRKRNHPDRFANLGIGTFFFVLGAAALGAFAWMTRLYPPGGLWTAGFVCTLFGTIALIGLSMVIQGAKNRPGSEGFFYRGFSWLGAHLTPVQATLAPLALCIVIVMEGLATRDLVTLRLGLFAALVWSSLFVQLFLHEVGHFLAVRRVHLPVIRLAAGPVTLVPHGPFYRFETNRKWLHFMMGAVYYELHAAPSPRKTLFVASAGPVATACIGLLAMAVRAAVPSGSLGYDVASANAAIAGGMLIMNLVPIRLGVMETDGLQIWHSVRSLGGIARS
jgi:hypothetical protein